VKVKPVVFLALTLLIVAAAAGRAIAGAATDALRPAVDRVLQILGDPAFKGAKHTAERRQALRAVMEDVIDFPDAAQRALSVHWQARTPAEREEFVTLFKELVSYSYIVTMEPYAGQSVVYVSETDRDGGTSVLTRLESPQRPAIPIEYRMHRRGDRWLVYDVIVEGVSLVGNYRDQFNSIIRTTSYPELVRRMKTRVEQLKRGSVNAVALTEIPYARARSGGDAP
jgi:phospholipid transport system substrate-binding protein